MKILFVCPFICPSSLLILFLIQTLKLTQTFLAQFPISRQTPYCDIVGTDMVDMDMVDMDMVDMDMED